MSYNIGLILLICVLAAIESTLGHKAAQAKNAFDLMGRQSESRRFPARGLPQPGQLILRRLLPRPFSRGEGWGEGLLGVVYSAVLAVSRLTPPSTTTMSASTREATSSRAASA